MTDGSLFDLDEVAPVVASPSTDVAGGSSAHTSSLYRKYRPQSFAADDLFGQDHVVNTLRNAIALNRIAHAYLFCGPRGTGKTTTARLMAKAVNCLDPDPHHRPCNACDACIAINKNATTDVIEIDAASNRGIDDIRDLRERVKYAPTQLSTKFYIIDEAHQITGAAANAFLKTLEEPPAHTKFILATTDPEELLPTIVSRCQRFDFRRIGLEAMSACLRKVATLEHIAIEDTAIDAIARHATGSLRDGLGLLDQISLYREHADTEDTKITTELVRTVLGISRNERVEGIVEAIDDLYAAAGLTIIGAAVDDGDDVRQLAKQILTYLRLLLLERAQEAPDADDVAKRLARRFELGDLADIARRFGDMYFKIKHAVLPQLPLELALVDATLRGSSPAVAALRTEAAPPPVRTAPAHATPPIETASAAAAPLKRSLKDRVRQQGPSGPARREPAPATTPVAAPPVAEQSPTAPRTEATPAPSGSNGNVMLETIVDLWPKIRADVKAVDRKAEAIMQQIDPVQISGSMLTLTSAYDFHRNRMNSDEIRRVVEDVVSRLISMPVQITCVGREEADQLRRQSPGTVQPPAASAPAPTVASPPAEPVVTPAVEAAPGDDERRVTAVRNIFDADEVLDS
jgi:DNA polymerase-3 subunit gamma/tau